MRDAMGTRRRGGRSEGGGKCMERSVRPPRGLSPGQPTPTPLRQDDCSSSCPPLPFVRTSAAPPPSIAPCMSTLEASISRAFAAWQRAFNHFLKCRIIFLQLTDTGSLHNLHPPPVPFPPYPIPSMPLPNSLSPQQHPPTIYSSAVQPKLWSL